MRKLILIASLIVFARSPILSEETIDYRREFENVNNRIIRLEQAQERKGTGWKTGYQEGGGGFFMEDPAGDFKLRVLGYVQFLFNYFDDQEQEARFPSGEPVSNDFSIRRARMDFLATLYGNTEFFIEYDGQGGSFSLIEARMTQRFHEAFQVRLGKFTTQFSNENRTSSRAIDTIERYAALNSLFLLPALDVQMGAMVFGNVCDRRYTYYAGVYNGNGRASTNLRDDNSEKEVQLRLDVRPWVNAGSTLKDAQFGVAFDWDREAIQSLRLTTLHFTTLSSVALSSSSRVGYEADAYLPVGRLKLRGEGIWYEFDDADTALYGGFVQAAYDVWSGRNGALVQPLVRAQAAVISDDRSDILSRVNILTIGWNAWLNKNLRWQLNYNIHDFTHSGPGAAVGDRSLDGVQMEFQVKI